MRTKQGLIFALLALLIGGGSSAQIQLAPGQSETLQCVVQTCPPPVDCDSCCPVCPPPPDPVEVNVPDCRDGIDNNGDGETDFPADIGCTDSDDPMEWVQDVPPEPDPDPDPVPPPAPAPSGTIAFEEQTQYTWPAGLTVWRASFADFNQDGCYDIAYGSHSDGQFRPLFSHDVAAGCSETWTQVNNDDAQYVQASPQIPRITSNDRYYDWTGNGLLDINGDDSDGSAPAFYPSVGPFLWGTKYKVPGAMDGKPLVMPFDANGDGVMDALSYLRTTGEVRVTNAMTGDLLWSDTNPINFPYVIFDVDGDTWPDLVPLSNRQAITGTDSYYKSDQDGTFTWTAGFTPWDGVQTFTAGQSEGVLGGMTFVQDFDLDGDLDLLIGEGARDASPNQYCITLQRNNGDGTYTKDESAIGCLRNVLNQSTVPYAKSLMADFDNNGYPDILYNLGSTANSGSVKNYYFFLNSGGVFTESTDDIRFGGGQGGRGVAPGVADYDGDGDLDIVKPKRGGSIHVWKNTASNGNWLSLKVRGLENNGLHVDIQAFKPGTNELVAHHYKAITNASQAVQDHHLGLADNASVDVRVQFPHGGPVYTFPAVAANQVLVVCHDGALTQGYTPGTPIACTQQQAGEPPGKMTARLAP